MEEIKRQVRDKYDNPNFIARFKIERERPSEDATDKEWWDVHRYLSDRIRQEFMMQHLETLTTIKSLLQTMLSKLDE